MSTPERVLKKWKKDALASSEKANSKKLVVLINESLKLRRSLSEYVDFDGDIASDALKSFDSAVLNLEGN